MKRVTAGAVWVGETARWAGLGQADEDALGTLLDEVAAQTSAVGTGDDDLDNFLAI